MSIGNKKYMEKVKFYLLYNFYKYKMIILCKNTTVNLCKFALTKVYQNDKLSFVIYKYISICSKR